MSESVETITDDPPLASPGWTVESEEQAAWAVDCILTARERLDRVTRQAAVVVADHERDLARTEAFFAPLIEEWLRAHPPRKGRTVHLVSGDVAFRSVGSRTVIVDDVKVIEWARTSLPMAIRRRTTEGVVVAEVERYVAHLPDEAPLPPGVRIEAAADRFYVSPPKGKK